jgi:hypothetical protein
MLHPPLGLDHTDLDKIAQTLEKVLGRANELRKLSNRARA